MGEGDRQTVYDVDVESLECPVARLERDKGEAQGWIHQWIKAKRVAKAGGVLYGPDSADWPARYFDVVDVLEGESQRAESAMHEAVGRRA